MSIKNLLIAYNGSESSDAALRLAALMHKKYDAHVTGLLAHQSAQARLKQETWLPDDLRSTLMQVESKRHAEIKQTFRGKAQPLIEQSKLHWLEHFGSSNQTIADYSLLYDITVAGRRDVLVGQERYEYHPDRIASRSGRPVVIVPRQYDETHIHEHAVLAWDGNRTATNAMWAAMNILETKQRVTVVKVNDGQTGEPLPGIDVVTALARHGIHADYIERSAGPGGTSATILDVCDAENAGVLVMGAYQTGALREKLFGSTSKAILERAKIPVLISG